MKNTNYLFPDTEKVGGVIFHYSKRLNGSFVKVAKQDINMVIEKLRKYKNISLKSTMEAMPLHVYIYPDIKSFRSAMGYEMQKVETRQMHFMMPNNIETRYILTDEAGNVHMVLPNGRSNSVYTTFSSELVSIIVGEYIALNEKQRYELKNTVKRYIKVEREKEEKEKQKEEEEAEEQKRLEEEEELQKEQEEAEEKERQEQEEERLEEERLQKELEEAEEQKREELLLENARIEEQELEEMAKTQEEVEDIKDVPAWLVYGWRGFVCNRLCNKESLENFKALLDKNKLPKPTKLNEKINSELDLDVAVSAVEYVCSTYGYGAYVKLCRDPENIKGILYSVTTLTENEAKEKFNSEVKQYISAKLSDIQIKEVIEVDKDNNLDEIDVHNLNKDKIKT